MTSNSTRCGSADGRPNAPSHDGPHNRTRPSLTMPTGPKPGLANAAGRVECTLPTQRAAWISSPITTNGPSAAASAQVATAIAAAIFAGPSDPGTTFGRMAPVSTTGTVAAHVKANR